MIADETSGPMKADVFPTTEKSAKKRNLQGTAAAREYRPSHRGSKLIGTAAYIDLADHGLAVRVPRADHQAIVCLVQPAQEHGVMISAMV